MLYRIWQRFDLMGPRINVTSWKTTVSNMVFETIVADVLNRFLGDYVENLDRSQLKIGIWGGKLGYIITIFWWLYRFSFTRYGLKPSPVWNRVWFRKLLMSSATYYILLKLWFDSNIIVSTNVVMIDLFVRYFVILKKCHAIQNMRHIPMIWFDMIFTIFSITFSYAYN